MRLVHAARRRCTVRIPMTEAERRQRNLQRYACKTIEGAIQLAFLQRALGYVAWWCIEEGDVWCYWAPKP